LLFGAAAEADPPPVFIVIAEQDREGATIAPHR